ncbi:MAG: alkaline phosphatase [Rhodospirillaceae bacterium]|nr:alkaline phosphatase [Rhodospirillaceae bacterium]
MSTDSPSDQTSTMGSVARNVILFIGDGMGVSTVTAARIFDGQSLGMSGEEQELIFETFPHVALVKTYNTNQQVPDSAGTATAMMTGRKTRAGVINIGPEARRRDCRAALDNPLKPLGSIARERGKSVGVVTTTRLTHATPAAVFAHSPERDWESDRYLPVADWELGCRDIAFQLTHFDVGDGLDVALGGGRAEFYGGGFDGNRVAEQDDLIQEWLDAGSGRTYITSRDELAQLQAAHQVLGIFSRSHMTYVAERALDTIEPTLAEMTSAAIDLLAEDEDGYFLMVEGGRIDHGHHEGKPGYALLETQAFARAIEATLEKVDLEETLVLVTADHSHVFTIAGYPVRGNPILGLVVENDITGEPLTEAAVDATGTPYTTLGYANGPGAAADQPRPVPEVGADAVYQAFVPVVHPRIDGSLDYSETHGGEDVALYGIGVGSDRVGGVIEQNLVFDIMIQAFGWEDAD